MSVVVEELERKLVECEKERDTWKDRHEHSQRLAGKWRTTADEYADQIDRLTALLLRYRTETPLGHQPHMIAAEVDALFAGMELSDEREPWEVSPHEKEGVTVTPIPGAFVPSDEPVEKGEHRFTWEIVEPPWWKRLLRRIW